MSHTEQSRNGTGGEEAVQQLSERVAIANELLGALGILLVAVVLLLLVQANAPF